MSISKKIGFSSDHWNFCKQCQALIFQISPTSLFNFPNNEMTINLQIKNILIYFVRTHPVISKAFFRPVYTGAKHDWKEFGIVANSVNQIKK